jgi:hypothetical protein
MAVVMPPYSNIAKYQELTQEEKSKVHIWQRTSPMIELFRRSERQNVAARCLSCSVVDMSLSSFKRRAGAPDLFLTFMGLSFPRSLAF